MTDQPMEEQPLEQSPDPEQEAAVTKALELAEQLMAWADSHVEKCADPIGKITALQTLAFSISLLYIVMEEFGLELICTLLMTRLSQICAAGVAAGLSDDTIIYGKPNAEEIKREAEAAGKELAE